VPLAEVFDLRAGDTKQWAVDGEFAELRNGFHTPESGGTGASEEVEKTGLDLIIGMMGENENFGFFPSGAFLEEGHAQLAGGEFQGFFFGCGELRSSRLGVLDAKSRAARLGDDEAGIGLGTPSAQGVVEMADDEVFETGPQKRVEQDHRVTAARDTYEEFFTLRNA
jgi:hypothetical protein